MPILAIWTSLCPKNLEATSITLFTGLINLSSNASNYFGAFLVWIIGFKANDFSWLWILVTI